VVENPRLIAERSKRLPFWTAHQGPPGSWVWGGILANLMPGTQTTWVNFENNDRAPLLFIAGDEDHMMPASVKKSNAKRYEKSSVLTEYKEFPGRSHYTVG
jgi:dienelactone hydrolase